MLNDENGSVSSLRVVMFAWFIGMLIACLYVVATTGSFPAIPMEYTMILGGLITGKVWQKGLETK